MRQLHFSKASLAGGRKKDEREAPGLIIEAPHFLQPDQLEKSHSRIRVGYADHSVEIGRWHLHSIRTSFNKTGVFAQSHEP